MPETGIQDLRARVSRLEADVASLREAIDSADDEFRNWRHETLDKKLGQMNAEIYAVRRAFDDFMAERKAWGWVSKLLMVAAAALVSGFVVWLAIFLLNQYALTTHRP